MSNHDPLTDSEVAFTALNLFRNEPRGMPPEWHEFEDFRSHALSDDRISEILSHVANDPDQFQRWRDLKEASDWVVEEGSLSLTQPAAPQSVAMEPASPTSLGEWFRGFLNKSIGQPIPALGGAVAAAVLAVLVVPGLMQRPALDDMVGANFEVYLRTGVQLPENALVPRITRSTGVIIGTPTPEQADRHHLQLGMQKAFIRMSTESSEAWTAWHDQLPVDSLECAGVSDAVACAERANDHISLGNWALMSYFACSSGKVGSGENFWQSQADMYRTFEARASVQGSAIVNSIFARSTPPANQQELCLVVDEIIAASL